MPEFAIPLTPFEFAMLVDDRPSHPMTFGVRLRFDRPLDFTVVGTAAKAVAARHPRLCGRVEGIDASRPSAARWVPAADEMTCERGELPNRPRPVDLRRGPGVRLTHYETDLLFEFHHACIDGLGVARFLDELFVRLVVPAFQPDSPAGTPELQDRNPGLARRLPFVLRRIATFYRHHPRPLAVPAETMPGGPAWHADSLSIAETDVLRTAAKRLGVTVNDLLIRDLFLALEAWNVSAGRPGGNIRLAVPMSTRDEITADVCNDVSMVFLDRRVRRSSPAALLQSVAAETAVVRRERLAAALLRALAILGRLPGGIRRVYAAPRCQSTSVVSNLGVLFGGQVVRIGDAELRDIHYLPPVRPLTRAVFVVATYAGRLTVASAIDPTVLSGDDGRRLLAGYVSRLRETALGDTP